MNSATLGASTSGLEVTNISKHGFWLFEGTSQEEFFLSFQEFPWFAEASIAQITDVRREGTSTLHWPVLDVDLDFERIRHPERFPLRSKI